MLDLFDRRDDLDTADLTDFPGLVVLVTLLRPGEHEEVGVSPLQHTIEPSNTPNP